jgi:lipopolysaccharide assembly outer membrane protein LptD (OstA)
MHDVGDHFFTTSLTTLIDTVPPKEKKDSLLPAQKNTDSLQLNRAVSNNRSLTDTTPKQVTDTFSLKLSKDSLDAPVKYEAMDSAVVLIKEKKIVLYGKTKTDYTDITLSAPRVELDQSSQIVTAFNSKDSTGAITESAHFKSADTEFTSDTIRYNFKTQKGLTKNTATQYGELTVIGDDLKKVDSHTVFIKRGQFTTCNIIDEPHFAFRTNKMKVVNEKIAVSGPAHPEFEGVPVPIYLPFGFFPLKQGRKSGLLPVQFATNEQFGLGFEGIGFYKVINEYWDVKFYGNIYSYGGWSFNVSPTYRKRYKYSGNLNLAVQETKLNFKGDPDFSKSRNYRLSWSHAVDSRARPGVNFSASVNAGSSSYNKFIPNSPQLNFQNQLSSSISYSKTWAGKPYQLSLTANHSQNNQTKLYNVSLPNLSFTVNTIYPFQKKEISGSPKWYEKLGVGYNGNLINQFSFYDTAFQFKRLIDTMQWGARNSFPINLSLPPILNGNLIVAPSISYENIVIAQTFRRTWNATTKKVDTTVTKGAFLDHQLNFGVGFNTVIYGTKTFSKSKKLTAIRHTLRPSVSMNYKPNLAKKHFYTVQVDTTGYTYRFSEYEGSLMGYYGEGRNGGIGFQVDNNLEIKWKGKKDTTERKIRVIDGYGFSSSYNFLADSMRLAPLSIYFRMNLFEKINITANSTLDPYQVNNRGQSISKYAWQGDKFSIGRLKNTNISMSTSFQSKPKDEKKAAEKKKREDELLNDPALAGDAAQLLEYKRQNPGEFVDFNIPWSLNMSVSIFFQDQLKPDFSGYTTQINSSMNLSGEFSLTPKWKITGSGYLDVRTGKLQSAQLGISREMHCWQLNINVAPVGLYRYFSFTLSPKGQILQDLKINRTRSFSNL